MTGQKASEAKINMIGVCELLHREGAHVPFNAGVVEIIRLAFPDDAVVFFGEQAHVEQVRKQVGPVIASSVAWKAIVSCPRHTNYFVRLVSDIKKLNYLLTQLRHNANGRLVFTAADPSLIVAMKLMKRLGFGNIRVQAIIHGNLKSGVIGRRHRHPLRRFQEMKTALTLFGRSSIQFLLLEEGIREQILKRLPSLAGNIEVLEHPLPPHEGSEGGRRLSRPIRFGFLGWATEMKGFPAFVELAAAISRKYPGQAEFHVIGRLASAANAKPAMEFLTTKPGLERLSREEFTELIKQLHFIIMPYHLNYYELSPSGTLLDAIAWEIPIIASKLSLFERVFKTYGDVGYLFGDEKELMAVVENLVNGMDASRYNCQVSNLHGARESRTPDKLAVIYREICDRGIHLGMLQEQPMTAD